MQPAQHACNLHGARQGQRLRALAALIECREPTELRERRPRRAGETKNLGNIEDEQRECHVQRKSGSKVRSPLVVAARTALQVVRKQRAHLHDVCERQPRAVQQQCVERPRADHQRRPALAERRHLVMARARHVCDSARSH
eukprot:2127013-Prymnesium_polylepis.2